METKADRFLWSFAVPILNSNTDGGKGSGNWGHEGVEGQLGGSAPGGGEHNRITTKSGKYTSFSKMKKDYAKPHKFSKDEFEAAPKGSIIITADGKFKKLADDYYLNEDTYDTIGINELVSLGDNVRIAVPDESNKNFSKKKATFSAERKSAAPRYESKESIDDLLREESGKVYSTLDKETKDVFDNYTASGHAGINAELRTGVDLGRSKDIKNITDAIEKTSLPDIWLARGVDREAASKFLGISFADLSDITLHEGNVQSVVGRKCKDKGFMSCGSTEGTGFTDEDVQFHIFCPEGTKGIYAEPFSSLGLGSGSSWDGKEKQTSFSDEFETILQRGTSVVTTKAWIEKSKNFGDNVLHIECEVVGQDY